MTDEQLTPLLDRLSRDVQVNPAPMPALLESGARLRRRRNVLRIAGTSAAVASLAVAGGLIAQQAGSPSSVAADDKGASVAAGGPGQTVQQAAFPPNSRLVGVNHAVIAVPKAWSTNEFTCGVPQANTVVINTSWTEFCDQERPEGVSSLNVQTIEGELKFPDLTAATPVTIDGVGGQLSLLECPSGGPELPCSQTLWIESEGALFTLTSTDQDLFDRVLGSVQIVDDTVAVPETDDGLISRHDADEFTAKATALGLQVDVTTQPMADDSRWDPGMIVDVQPATGTVLEPGDVVHLTVAGE